MSEIDYEKLFQQEFDPRISLFDKIIENVPNSKNQIHLDEKLNKFAKDDVFEYISKKYQPNANFHSHSAFFEQNSYSEYNCCFQFQIPNNQENIKNEIINNTFKELESKGILHSLSNPNIDLIGIYLFISKTGFIVCFVNCAQTDDTFSPEKFLNALKTKAAFTQDIKIDNEDENGIQSLADQFAPKFSECYRNAQKEFGSIFQKKYSYNSAYYRLSVTSNKNNQIVDSILNNDLLKSFLNQKFDKIGIQLFNVEGLKQILIIISNSNIDPPKGLEILNQLIDDVSGSELFDDIKASPQKKRKSAFENESDENNSKHSPIPQNNSIDIYMDDEEEEDDNFYELPKFNSPSPLRNDIRITPNNSISSNSSPLKLQINNSPGPAPIALNFNAANNPSPPLKLQINNAKDQDKNQDNHNFDFSSDESDEDSEFY